MRLSRASHALDQNAFFGLEFASNTFYMLSASLREFGFFYSS